MATSISPLAMLDLIERKDQRPIEAITDSNGNKVFSSQDAREILEAFGQWKAKCAMGTANRFVSLATHTAKGQRLDLDRRSCRAGGRIEVR